MYFCNFSELVGKWYLQKEKDVEVYYEFSADHKFRKIALNHVTNPDFTGLAEFTRSEKGTWKLRGDSLCIVHEPGKKYHLDASNIKANEKSKVFLHCEMQTVGMICDEAEEILL